MLDTLSATQEWPVLVCDEPAEGGSARAGGVVNGWAYSPAGIASIGIWLDGSPVGPVIHGGERPDVGADHPTWTGARHSGFRCQLAATLSPPLPPAAELVVVAEDGLGRRAEVRRAVVPDQSLLRSSPMEAPSEGHRLEIGGLWDEVGKLQFDFLVAHGLRPDHYLLDVGCGTLRGGVHFIGYLDRGRYYGIDRNRDLLATAREIELVRYGLTEKEPVLVEMADFGFDRLGRRFDIALAQSVFTHLPLNDIIRCLMNIERVLAEGGEFYATYFENPAGKRNLDPVEHRLRDGSVLTSFFDADPYHYDVETFRWICAGTGLEVEHLGEWNHPRDQRMLRFKKTATAGTT